MAEDEYGNWIPDNEVPDSIKKTNAYRKQRSDKDIRVCWFEDHPGDRYHGGAPEKIYIEITNSYLVKMFGVSRRTVYRWIGEKQFDPSDLLDIIRFYNSRHKELPCHSDVKIVTK